MPFQDMLMLSGPKENDATKIAHSSNPSRTKPQKTTFPPTAPMFQILRVYIYVGVRV